MRPFYSLRHTSRATGFLRGTHPVPEPISLSQHTTKSRTRTITSTTTSQPCPRKFLLASHSNQTPRRAFNLPSLSSILPSSSSNNSSSNGGNGNNSSHRVLTATRTLPYPPETLYKVISAVESYSQFLPFLTASTVTARDPVSGYPMQAFLTVGYGPLSETFTSRVDCDREKWVVEARSGARFGRDGQPESGSSSSSSSPLSGISGFFPGANEGIFEYLSTRWQLVPLSSAEAGQAATGGGSGSLTKVDLEVRFEFRSQLHATVMGTVEGQMAAVMVEAFEKRIREVEGRPR
ncbi:hypothetical protein NUU61_005227 [Penicillium alfredii]|uniref:Coenzyme Q-binding protein COQ10 START domain-containing protein n=1 Tax=Penicillium alfredii TaxID=1506179 RepID=A0A9W9F929_9EURO|nr:uncharacterized protein NUU61_005227 [Penicillium alfredii]KAJ5095871.1 hypothetical protein NUU61_005227 [Penicillium alfredii]